MATTDLDFANLDQLVTALKAAGVRSASIDPAELNLPGVLIEVTGVSLDLLAGVTIKLNLVCLVSDDKPKQAAKQLQALFNKVADVARAHGGPTDDSTVGRWVLPGSAAELPGISVPLDLITTSEE